MTILLLFLIVMIVAIVINNSGTIISDYDMSTVTLNDEEVAYDGNEHSLEIEGDLPDGVTVRYTYDDKELSGETEVGTYTVVASF